MADVAEILDQRRRAGQHQQVIVDDEDAPGGAGGRRRRRALGDCAPARPRSVLARGSHSSTVVPTFGVLSMRSWPPDCAARPCTIDKPSPVPLPGPLVVKKGSVAFASVASSMPTPVSEMAMRTYSPAFKELDSPGCGRRLRRPPEW